MAILFGSTYISQRRLVDHKRWPHKHAAGKCWEKSKETRGGGWKEKQAKVKLVCCLGIVYLDVVFFYATMMYLEGSKWIGWAGWITCENG